MAIFSPNSTIGILGSGQLGRMLALAAGRMGYRIHTLAPEADSPTGQVAEREVVAPFSDLDVVRVFARGVDVVTYEFENVPLAAVTAAAGHVPVRPAGKVLHTTQNRLREKQFLSREGLPIAPYAPVQSLDDLRIALTALGMPAILKTAAFGYDGKGQVKIEAAGDAEAAWDAVGPQPAVLEAYVAFDRELSIVAARGLDGSFAHYGLIENRHVRHILDLSLAPAEVSPAIAERAVELARCVVDRLEVVGVLCVELFQRGDDLLINELAPRPHNSGHYTIDACLTSQFEQHVRAICGLPLGSTEQIRPAAMANILGDLWIEKGREPNWPAALALPDVKLHLYGKRTPRPGRKMGHLTALGDTVAAAVARVRAARQALVT
jgi:5-(carboxyamino)imidazole ribonucleotide synthase